MHVVIAGNRYEFGALNRASLLDLIELKKQTGLSVTLIQGMYERLEQAAKDPDFDFLGDQDNLLLMATVVWLSRRKAGERLSFEESADVPLSEIEFVPDADEDEAGVPVEEPADPH